MKLGLVTAFFDQWTFEETMDFMGELGLECAEVACWPSGKAERRYAGVSHIDVDRVLEDDDYAEYIVRYAGERGITISSLAFYPNTMDGDKEKRKANVAHLKKVIKASSKLGVNLVTTFIGRDQTLSVEDNLKLVKKVWPPIIALAEELGVKIGIENCPMLFGKDQWPGGQNLMTTPEIWKKVFDILKSDNLGINYDPSHFVWQMIDYIKPVYEFKDKIFHVHFKDIKLYREKLERVGVMAYPLDFMQPKLPGLGDVNWSKFVSALTDIGYDGFACMELEDYAFEANDEKKSKAVVLSMDYIQQYVI